MPFREAFDCLWCGRAHRTRSGEDLEGWAGLCPECVGRAGDNGFLRFRVRSALQERARSAASPDLDAEMKAYYAGRAPEYDEIYGQRGGVSGGSVLDLWRERELDEITGWLDRVPLSGEIVELAAGTGWWSPLLAQKGDLSLYDINAAPLDIARGRLVAHGLRAHIHVRDAWQEPDRQVDGVFCGFWLSHVPRARLSEFLGLVARWLRAGGMFAFLDERAGTADPDPAADPQTGITVRRLGDDREFRIPKVYYARGELESALAEAGFDRCEIRQTERYFLMGTATR
ncbi:MAG: class I SAM-dependent methyltransferase [Chloroflexota bacterium]|nr:class I SAM-dependent methyltransferase [Chloroflexota bacterium]